MRTFIAVEISEEQRSKLRELQDKFRETGADIKFVEPENLHLTLRFLGEISEQDLGKVKEGCEKALENLESFDMELKGAGVFPNLNYIKIIWVGIEKGKNELELIKKNLDEFIQVGEKDFRKFSPHITIGRVKNPKNKEKIIELVQEFSKQEFGTCKVQELKIKMSELKPDGPVYSDLESIKI